jgi:hypothetical protein
MIVKRIVVFLDRDYRALAVNQDLATPGLAQRFDDPA